MGTTWSLRFVAHGGVDADALQQQAQAALDRIIAQMSNWHAGTAIDRYNNAPAGSWHSLDIDFYRVMRTGLDVAEATDGAFDPTTGPLVDLWGFGPALARLQPPSFGQIAAVLPLVGWDRIELDHAARRLLQPGGARLDLSGIAKGYAVDMFADLALAMGAADVLAEIGGELVGRGVQSDGQPWWVDIENPPDASALPVLRIALHEMAVATSGDYRRFFNHAGRRYAHSIDPRTGLCVDNGVASVTVLHPSCMVADALATALHVLGPEEGLALATARNQPALFLVRTANGYEERMTPAMADMLD